MNQIMVRYKRYEIFLAVLFVVLMGIIASLINWVLVMILLIGNVFFAGWLFAWKGIINDLRKRVDD